MPQDDALIERIASRLMARAEHSDAEPSNRSSNASLDRPPVRASVLIGLIRREVGFTVLYTQRSPDLNAHSGQIAFPGGRADSDDADEGMTALREAEEEVGLDRADARVLGYMGRHHSGSGFLITPVVALVEPRRRFVANPGEVADIFEVPLAWLARGANYGWLEFERPNGGGLGSSWHIDHEHRRIWGITANITRQFRDLALEADTEW